jgi:hypothetical protein
VKPAVSSPRLIFAAAALPFLNVLAFGWLAATTVISRDQWRFLPMVQDWYAGRFQWDSLWLSHSQHRTPGYKLEFLLNAIIFRLDMRVEVMLGAMLLAGAVLLLARHFLKTLPAMPAMQRMLAAAAVAWLALSLNQWDSLVYGLGAVSGFGHVFFFVLFWLWLDASLHRDPSPRDVVGLTALLAFVLLFWAAGHGPALLASVTAALLVTGYGGGMASPRRTRLYAALAAAAILAELVYWLAGPLAPVRSSSAAHIGQMLAAPGRVVEFLLMALSGSALPVSGMEHHGWPHGLTLFLGAAIGATYAICIVAFIRRRLWSVSYVPAFLMAYSLLEIASVLMVRFGEGQATAAAPRYVLDNALGLLGCFWTLVLWQAAQPRLDAAWRKYGVPGLSAAALLTAVAASAMLWGHLGEQRRNVQAAVQQVRAGDFEAQDWICPDVQLCAEGVEFLRRERLNIFRDETVPIRR